MHKHRPTCKLCGFSFGSHKAEGDNCPIPANKDQSFLWDTNKYEPLIGCVQHDCADCQQRKQSAADLVREAERVRKQKERLVNGLIQIRDSTYRNSATLRAIAADLLDTYTDGR